MDAFTQRSCIALIAAASFLAIALIALHVDPAGSSQQQSPERERTKTRFSCSFEGTRIPDGGRIDLYREPSVSSEEKCIYESRYCKVGILTSGFYTNRSCFVRAQ